MAEGVSGDARQWSFQSMLVASGMSELETTTTKELLKLIASDDRLSSWKRCCSYRIVSRRDVEALVRTRKNEELQAAVANEASVKAAAGETDAGDATGESQDARQEQTLLAPPSAAESATLAGTSSQQLMVASSTSSELLPKLEEFAMTPQLLAAAFQRLVREDKEAFLAYNASFALSTSSLEDGNVGAESSAVQTTATGVAPGEPSSIASSSNESPLADLLAQLPARDGSPTRIYLLTQYPSSLAEMQVLLRTGEAGSVSHGELPLLPLIDGALLVLNSLKELQGRRKSIGLADERFKSAPQRNTKTLERKALVSDNGAASTLEKLNPAAVGPSVFQTVNPLVREFYDASSVGGLEWTDFVFADLPVSEQVAASREPKVLVELAKAMLTSVETLAAQKYEFKHWVATTKMIPIPRMCLGSDAIADGEASETLELYEQMLRRVYEPSIGVSMVLFAMKEAIASSAESGSGSDSFFPSDANSNQSCMEEFIAHSDSATLRLAVAYTHFATQLQGTNNAIEGRGDPCSILDRKIDEVEKEMWTYSDLPGVGNSGRKGMPLKPSMPPTDRGIQDTEFALFTKFDVAKVHFTRQLLQFEELLGPAWKGKLQPSRCFVEHLDRQVLPQRLVQMLGNFPAVHKEYYAPTDSLLVATLSATAPGRFRTTQWTARDHVRHRPAFKDWRKEQLLPEEYLTPRTLKALAACVPLSSAELGLLAEKTSVLFPSDQSVIRVYQTPRGYTWLSVYQGGDVFGFRQIDRRASHHPAGGERNHAMQFCASFDDHSLLHIVEGRALPKKPDGFTTICVTNTFPSGLSITVCSDGSIVQRYASKHAGHEGKEEKSEVYRLIVGKGTVLREFSQGERVILLANGDVKHIGGHPTAETEGDGFEDDDVKKPERIVDPATNALVEKRPNGVIIVTHTDGARVVYHTDGTRMCTNASKSHVLVKKQGFADVWVDIAVNYTARRHANGERVAITKGGLRTRSIVEVYEGTRIEVGYNTKVVAQVNGRVTTRKSHGLCIVAKDSGRVEYHSRFRSAATTTSETSSAEDDDLDVTSHNGVYYFDCKEGKFELCDHEQNQFLVDLGECSSPRTSNGGMTIGCPAPKISVDLAGVVSELEAEKYKVDPIPARAVVNDPIEPHLLVLHGDGTGKEILRPRDIEHYLGESSSHAGTNRKEVYAGCEASYDQTRHRVFFEELQCSTGDPHSPRQQHSERKTSGAVFNDDNLLTEMDKLMKPVSSAAKHLPNYPAVRIPHPRFTLVRRIQQFRPLSASELQEMHTSLCKWKQWQDDREVNKNQYKVVDPRDEDTIAQQLAVQKKVLAAYKATRSRKKLETQKAREMKRKLLAQEHLGEGGGGVAHMETVQEGDEPQMDEDDSDEFDYSSSSGSGKSEDFLDDEVDDPDELLWTAFSQADAANSSKLSVAQTRQALVHVLGFGVPTSELTTALRRYRLQDPSQVGFDTFAELVHFFRSSDENSNPSSGSVQGKPASSSANLPALQGLPGSLRSGCSQQQAEDVTPRGFIAAGSATEAIRLKKNLE